MAALNLGVEISVAGGVKASTAAQVRDAGATIIVAGAAIYGAADPAASAAEITAIAHGGQSSGGLFGWLKGLFS